MNFDVLTGDVVEVLPTLPANSFDAALCDPPYALTDVARTMQHAAGSVDPNTGRKRSNTRRRAGGFMGKEWDAELPGVDCWRELLRVLKPGALLLAFGGARTHHRLMCALEDAGFEIRDTLCWLYGSGFPKSLDISKAIDKAAGAERKVVGKRLPPPDSDYWKKGFRPETNTGFGHLQNAPSSYSPNPGGGFPDITAPSTDAAKRWSGYGTALKPAWEPCIVAMKPLDGTFAHNAGKWGVAGINVDGSRIPSGADHREKCESVVGLDSNRNGNAYGQWTGKRESSWTPAGRWPSNVLLGHTERCGNRNTEDCPECGHEWRLHTNTNACCAVVGRGPTPNPPFTANVERCYCERLPWCSPDCAARQLDQMSGESVSNDPGTTHVQANGWGHSAERRNTGYAGDRGGASRFFYTAKVSTAEREGSDHPTMKPIDLTRYLAKLILPPQRNTPRRIIVPFAGVGSEMIGAILAGWDDVVGIEKDEKYAAKARERIVGTAPLFLQETATK